MKPFYVYLLRCADASLYAGHTDDLDQRVAQHRLGEVEGYTQTRRPVELVWSQETATRDEALAAERQIKGWSRAKKEALIRGDWTAIQRHAWGTKNPLPAALAGSSFDTSGRSGTLAQGEGPSIPQDERGSAAPVRPPLPAHPEPSTPAHPEPCTPAHPEPCTPAHPEVSKDALLVQAVVKRERRALAKAITLLESTRADHRERADELLNALLPRSGKSLRLGISGVPGVGKSTFIEALGLFLIERGHRVAVLAVDPSSTVSGGSILGDKTRMERLSVEERAFIRPSPSSGTLGGVAEKTREAMLVCEAAGHDIVIVETVGVGQSETAVAGMTDMFILMQLPNAGDDLQAIKKGVMERADLVLINKADLDAAAATRAEAQISSSLRLLGMHGHDDPHDEALWHPQVLQLSALKSQGLTEFWQAVEQFRDKQQRSGRFDSRRQQQDQAWMWERIEAGLRTRFRQHPRVREALASTMADVLAGRLAASVAARRLLDLAS